MAARILAILLIVLGLSAMSTILAAATAEPQPMSHTVVCRDTHLQAFWGGHIERHPLTRVRI
jgi:hypothetical protein